MSGEAGEITKHDRTSLIEKFENGDRPVEEDYHELIHSVINLKDDGIIFDHSDEEKFEITNPLILAPKPGLELGDTPMLRVVGKTRISALLQVLPGEGILLKKWLPLPDGNLLLGELLAPLKIKAESDSSRVQITGTDSGLKVIGKLDVAREERDVSHVPAAGALYLTGNGNQGAIADFRDANGVNGIEISPDQIKGIGDTLDLKIKPTGNLSISSGAMESAGELTLTPGKSLEIENTLEISLDETEADNVKLKLDGDNKELRIPGAAGITLDPVNGAVNAQGITWDGDTNVAGDFTCLENLSTNHPVGVGSNDPVTCAQFEIKSDSLGLLIPRLSHGEIEALGDLDADANGLILYDATSEVFRIRMDGRWAVPVFEE